ncbi:MAG TPA: hypothetical protein VEK55_11740 [Xanthobacteraceae bacterium]|nr:hypothetical protein [Xanthobacteraceae bacterium]
MFVPEKHPFVPNDENPNDHSSLYGTLENAIITHVRCEIAKGIWRAAHNLPHVPWLYRSILDQKKKGAGKTPPAGAGAAKTPAPQAPPAPSLVDWGTSVTLTLTFQDQGAVNPNTSLIAPLENSVRMFPVGGNVTSPQSITWGFGVNGSANATRTETIQFTYLNKDLYYWAEKRLTRDPETCEKTNTGTLIESDLKIDEFIYDKATIASLGNDIGGFPRDYAPFNTFQEQITFVVAYGGSFAPMWKFATVAVNPTGTLAAASRTNTDSLTITLGPAQPASPSQPAQLASGSATLHATGVGATQTGTQIRSTTPAAPGATPTTPGM